MSLTPTQRRALKARAHALDPVVRIGSHGLTEAVVKEIDVNLRAHELIKVHVAGEDRDTRRALLEQICQSTGAEAVQTIGRMLVLWREGPEPAAPRPAKPGRRPPRAPKRVFQDR
jgi:RNA-binding protein